MALERTYNIPLRKEWLRAPKYRRAKRAVAGVRTFLAKHMKSAEIKIGPYLNEAIWARGIKNPPHHVEVKAVKDDKGVVMAELVGAPVEKPVEEVKEAPVAKVEPATEAPKIVEAERAPETPAAAPAEKPAPKQEKAEKPKAKPKARKKPTKSGKPKARKPRAAKPKAAKGKSS